MTDAHEESYQGLDTLEDARIWRIETIGLKVRILVMARCLFGHTYAA